MSESSYKLVEFSGAGLSESLRNMVTSRWCRSLKFSNDHFKLMHGDSYWKVYPPFVRSLLERPATEVRVAVLSDEPDNALGFAVYEGPTLHYLHVDKVQRRQGIGTSLVAGKTFDRVTHITRLGISFWTARLGDAKFDPFA